MTTIVDKDTIKENVKNLFKLINGDIDELKLLKQKCDEEIEKSKSYRLANKIKTNHKIMSKMSEIQKKIINSITNIFTDTKFKYYDITEINIAIYEFKILLFL
jgi:hypothetical protein